MLWQHENMAHCDKSYVEEVTPERQSLKKRAQISLMPLVEGRDVAVKDGGEGREGGRRWDVD